MLKTLIDLVDKDEDLPERAHRLEWLEQFRTGRIYDNLKYEFHEEKVDDEYIPLASRRPSVRFGLPVIIVNDSTSLLFGEGHFPAVEFNDEDAVRKERAETAFADLIKASNLKEIMLDAAVRGSVGSIAVMFKVSESNRVFWEVMSTQFLTPEWDADEPDRLRLITEKYKVKGKRLMALGYAIAEEDKDASFWFQRRWTAEEEIWYLPWPVQSLLNENRKPRYAVEQKDEKRSVVHGLGFVPLVWIRNLPGGDKLDGACTFEKALSNSIEIDYQLSQAGRGLKYTSDPTLFLREPVASEGGNLIKGAANAMIAGEGSDAKLLEISGSGAAAVLEHVRALREFSLELCGGNRASPEKLSGAQSGRAMELMNQSLIWLADKLRTSYGENGLIALLRMVVAANKDRDLLIAGEAYAKGSFGEAEKVKLTLKWPPWYAPTAADHNQMATAIKTYRDAGVLSQETGVRFIQHDFDIEDVDEELKRINEEAEARAKQEQDAQLALVNAKRTASALSQAA